MQALNFMKNSITSESGTQVKNNLILTIGNSVEDVDLRNQLSYFGFELLTLDNVFDLSVIENISPKALLFNADHYSINALVTVQEKLERKTPTIVFSKEMNIEQHKVALNNGCVHLADNYDIAAIVEKLDEIENHDICETYRVLIIEDSESMANFYKNLLNNNGMNSRVVTNPFDTLKQLKQFNPDLILMDMHMPDCSGNDLAQMIRQREAFFSIPIIFLSGESNLDLQVATMTDGAEDFLNKDISSSHLLKIIAARIDRSRKLRSLMHKDSLTGLLNHSAILSRLDSEVIRAKRNFDSLVYAMIDIDHFKLVNDSFGHSSGDIVIKNLSRLIQQRLRKSDVIGRYGGEEFAIIMPDTTIHAAYNVLDDLRKSFSKIRQIHNNNDFFVSFSCGISKFTSGISSSQLSDQADKALYKAKEGGRNQTIIF